MQDIDDEHTQATDSETKRAALERQLGDSELYLKETNNKPDVDGAYKLPLGKIAALGAAFSSLPNIFQTAQTSAKSSVLFEVTDKLGNPIDPALLQRFRDGSGYMGSMRNTAHGFEQVRLHSVTTGSPTNILSVPYNPSLLLMGVALVQINQKLDTIKETVDEMLEYMRQKDKARLRANLEMLAEIFNAYGFDYGNERCMSNAHMKILDIQQDAEQDIVFLRGHIETKLQKKGIVEIRPMVQQRLDDVLDNLKDYQLCVYIYAFASSIEPLFCENFKKERLENTIKKIEDQSLQYRKTYTQCYSALKQSAQASIDARILGGISEASTAVAKTVAASPVGGLVTLDENLEGAGKDIAGFNDSQTSHLLEKLYQAQSPDVLAFEENITTMDSIYNEAIQVFVDSENIYLLPKESKDQHEK